MSVCTPSNVSVIDNTPKVTDAGVMIALYAYIALALHHECCFPGFLLIPVRANVHVRADAVEATDLDTNSLHTLHFFSGFSCDSLPHRIASRLVRSC